MDVGWDYISLKKFFSGLMGKYLCLNKRETNSYQEPILSSNLIRNCSMEGVILFADDHIFEAGRIENALFQKFNNEADFSILPINKIGRASCRERVKI